MLASFGSLGKLTASRTSSRPWIQVRIVILPGLLVDGCWLLMSPHTKSSTMSTCSFCRTTKSPQTSSGRGGSGSWSAQAWNAPPGQNYSGARLCATQWCERLTPGGCIGPIGSPWRSSSAGLRRRTVPAMTTRQPEEQGRA